MAYPVEARAELTIGADAEAVWDVLTRFADWPAWNPGVTRVTIDGPVAVGTTFRWKTGPSTIVSTIIAAGAPWRIVWTGRTLGIRAEHRWELSAADGGTLVRTDETWRGALPRLAPGPARKLLQRTLTDGLAALERRVGGATAG